jgi:mannose-6-phosphate isomerase-like protein (cupin superfamily)
MIAKENHPETKINSASCEIIGAGDFDRGIARKLIMPGEISSIKTFCVDLRGGTANECLPEENKLRILLFTSGSGNVKQDGFDFVIDELALFVPDIHREFTIVSSEKSLSYLEIILHLSTEDLLFLGEHADKFPYYVRYSESRQYDEPIKSGKTVSRIILSEDIVPRLCIGSVQTSGPDEVGAHTHPMLEQLFLGLAGNDVVVMADSAEAKFLENDLLHIPLGSSHGVKVGPGKSLHYIWIDFFHSIQDMDYITNSHILKDK